MSLFSCNDCDIWRSRLNQYAPVMKKKAEDKKKKELSDLDSWFQTDLPDAIAARCPRHITKDEITKLMKWKLMRGKFRPRLTELIQQNTEKDVKLVSEKAFSNAGNVSVAIKELSKLKGVGPATASAIMCAANPEQFAFMADEAMSSIPSFKVDYTLPHYQKFMKILTDKAMLLNKKENQFEWTPHKVELALWVDLTAKKVGLDLEPIAVKETVNGSGRRGKKRASNDSTEHTGEVQEQEAGTKKSRK
ncbi:uncharacterized protein LOC135691933 [Rhopilema esculentum]|uniref:uncharacterized protein LOC135691933 n=1 Tax=Rhopilema esculentum TaxID=499914 RepID=UPI0031D8324F|eukprot:gene9162-16830_t